MSGELIKLEGGKAVPVENIEAQFQLLKMFNLPPTAAETHKVERKDGHWTLTKRERPVILYADDDGRMRSVVQVQKTEAEKVGLDRPREGKYNDENRLYAQDSASIEVKEVQAWGSL